MTNDVETFGERGRYQVERDLGEGAWGRVVLARDQELDRPVALKILPARLLSRDTVRERFQREARVQASLEHPHVVRVFDCRLDLEQPFLVMEYVDGRDLSAVLREDGALTLGAVRRMAWELGDALDTLHEKGVLHRDIKPSNVMVRREDGSSLLMDLGLASQVDAESLTRTGQVVGTPRYFPPEVIAGEGWSDAGDQFQLAAVLFEALTLEHLIPGKTLDQIVIHATRGVLADFPPDSPVPLPVQAVVRRAGEPDPEARFSSARELARALSEEEEGGLDPRGGRPEEPTWDGGRSAATPPPPLEGSDPGARSGSASAVVPAETPRRWPVGALAGLLALLSAGLVASLLARPAPRPRVLRMEVVGDALVVELDPAGARDLRVLLDGTPLTGRVDPQAGVLRYVHHGLPSDRDRTVRVVWEGNEGVRAPIRSRGAAVADRLEILPERRVRLVAARPIRAAWVRGGGGPFTLEEGVNLVPAPRPARFALRWEEEGVPFRRDWSTREVFLPPLRDLDELLAQVGLPARLDLHSLTELAGRTGHAVEEWRGLAPWIPDILLSDLPVAELRRFHEVWEGWDRSLRALKYFTQNPENVEVPEGRAGDKMWPAALWPDAAFVEADLYRTDGTAVPAAGAEIVTREALGYSRRKYPDVPPEAFFRWPVGAPREGEVLGVALRVDRLTQGYMLQLQSMEEEGSAQPFLLSFWHPRFKLTGSKRYRGWIVSWIPARLAPAAGTRVRVEHQAFVGNEESKVRIHGLRIYSRAADATPWEEPDGG